MTDKFRNSPILMNEVIERLYRRCDEEELKHICDLLDKIYLVDGKLDKNFRHEYSSISGKMEELRSEYSDEENPFDLQNISININLLYEYAERNGKIYLKNLYKLRDHICLEIGRIAYADKIYESITNAKSELQLSIDAAIAEVKNIDSKIEMSKSMLSELEEKHNKFSKEIENLQEKINSTNTEIESTNESLKSTNQLLESSKNKIKSYQQESIAILGIFASIVLAVTGGLGFSSSVLQSINAGTIYRVCFVILLLGLVLINILFVLFYYIDRLVNNIQDRQIKPQIVANCVIIALLCIILLLWQNGYVEKVQEKNKNIHSESAVTFSNNNY